MDDKLTADIDQFIADNKNNIIRDIARIVAVNSTEGLTEDDAPFGRGPAEALKIALSIAAELGLEAINCENMIGYAKIGDAEKYIATITHLDIVPPGDGWTGDPFKLRELDNYLIGRGVMDDKGPSVICLYALKYLQKRNYPLRYSVRALFGINEESNMSDVEYYLKNYTAPVFCFSPDSGFPVCNGEKGICRGRIVSKKPIGNIVKINGGIAANVIPDKAEAWVNGSYLKPSDSVMVERCGEMWHLTAKGIGGHASKPMGTENAIGILIDYILERSIAEPEEERYFRFLKRLHDQWDGSALGIQADDGLFDPLTIVGGVIGVENGRVFQIFDVRYPTNCNAELISSVLSSNAGDTAEIIIDSDSLPFYTDIENPAIKQCMAVYNYVTGEKAKSYTMGGATYARHFPNAISFGPEHPERPRPVFAGAIHGADEAASLSELLEALKIYILALIQLQKIDF